MSVSTLDTWTAASIFLGVGILFGVAIAIRLIAIVATGFVEKEGKRKGDPPADASGFSRKCRAKQGANTEEKNQDFFHRAQPWAASSHKASKKGRTQSANLWH
jgi:hypothetical protein